MTIIMALTGHHWLHRKEQTFCGLKGLVLDDKPVTKGSCRAFCRQNNWRSAAAWETWEHKENTYVKLNVTSRDTRLLLIRVAN